jgi:hypothetical protein
MSKNSQTPEFEPLILEPILTPSGLIDGFEDQGIESLEQDIESPLPELEDFSDDVEPVLQDESLSELLGDFEVVPFENAIAETEFDAGVFVVGESGTVEIDFLFDGGGFRKGEVGIFSLEGIDFDPDTDEFVQEAVRRSLSGTDGHIIISDSPDAARFSARLEWEGNFNTGGEYKGVQSFEMRPGEQFGIILSPNNSLEDYLDGSATKQPLLSLSSANPGKYSQFGQIVDVTGDGNTFAFEDLTLSGSSDKDYNDFVFQVRGAEVNEVALMDDLVNPNRDWRNEDIGQALVEYAKAYVVEDVSEDVALTPGQPTIDFDAPPAAQPLVGVIDTGFSADNPDIDYDNIITGSDLIDGDDDPFIASGEGNEHGTHILGIIAAEQDNDIGIDGINDDAPIWVGRAVGSGRWADSLIEFVDAARESDQPNAVVNLSMDLTQIDANGEVLTRYELTPQERAALEYARQNNVMVVAAAGNDGSVMSALGQASQEFDNIVTVGAANNIERADYSSYGYGLDLMANVSDELSTVEDGVGSMTGTSVAAAKVTGAASQVWAANPELSYRQVIHLLKDTAADIGESGFDLETGAGLLNIAAAVQFAKVTKSEEYDVLPTIIPDTWSGEGQVTPGERAANVFDWLPSGGTTAIINVELQRLNGIKSIVTRIANDFNVHPAIVAGIISRETNTRNILGDGGRGHGYMQLDIGTFPNIKNQPWQDPEWNIRTGVNLLINDKYAYLESRLPTSLHLRGSLAAYNSGQGNVYKAYQRGLDVDAYTTKRNYSADVLNRARWLARNGWGSNNISPPDDGTPPDNSIPITGRIPESWQMSSSAKGVGQVAVGRNQDGRMEAFVIGPDNKVYQSWQTAPNSGWSDWKQLSDGIAKSLTVSRNKDGRMEVFAIGNDNNIYHIWQTAPNSGWSNWQRLPGGTSAQDLTVGINADGRMEVFAVGTDSKVY